MQLIVMRAEGARGRAAIERLQYWRLHLQHTLVIEKVAQGFDRTGAFDEDLTHSLVDGQIGITLPIASFGIFEFTVFDNGTVFEALLLDHRQRA